jgi:hypothetical protein
MSLFSHLRLAALFGVAVMARADTPKSEAPAPAAVSTIKIDELSAFDEYPRQIQSLVQSALALTRLQLGYVYGSSEPGKGGMDCSGTVYHTLRFQGLKDVPRQSDEMCSWVEKKGRLNLTPTATGFDHAEFADLKPGDLLFWTNTMETKRKLPVTHVMIYLGKLKKNGKHVVFGASDGRSFEGQRRSGVSVFDLHLPKADSTSRLYGYGAVPGLMPAAPTPTPTPPVIAKAPPEKEEVRKAVSVAPEPKAETKKPVVVETKGKQASKPKTTTPKKPAPAAKKKTPAPPSKSPAQRTLDQALDSVRRFLR